MFATKGIGGDGTYVATGFAARNVWGSIETGASRSIDMIAGIPIIVYIKKGSSQATVLQ